jgi:hypothetical protein
MTVSTTTQQSFAEVDDDGGANAGTLGTTNANWTQLTDTVFRIRFLVDTTGKAETDGYHLYQNYNGTGYQRVTTSSTEVQSVASGFGTPPADGTATTQRIGSGTFTAGEWDNNGAIGGERLWLSLYGRGNSLLCTTVLIACLSGTDSWQRFFGLLRLQSTEKFGLSLLCHLRLAQWLA